jgi:outer membrane receptor protein involved in Fe transport
VGAQLSHTYVGPQYADDANTEAENITGELGRIPGYHTLDAGVRYRHEPSGLSASVVVKNLPNQPYVVARRPQGIFVGGLRQIVGTLRWDYR